MNYGTQETAIMDKDGSTISLVEDVYRGEVSHAFQHFFVRIKVENTQEETAEYLTFTDRLRELRSLKQLYIDPEDRQSLPAFIVHYPKKDIDGSYFVILNWCEYMVKSG